MVESANITQELHNKYKELFSGIRYCKGAFPLQDKEGTKPYQTPPRHVAYALQEPFKKDLERPQEQQIIVALGVEVTATWFKSLS